MLNRDRLLNKLKSYLEKSDGEKMLADIRAVGCIDFVEKVTDDFSISAVNRQKYYTHRPQRSDFNAFCIDIMKVYRDTAYTVEQNHQESHQKYHYGNEYEKVHYSLMH